MLAVPRIRKNITAGLVGWWTMDSSDISGTALFDKSKNGQNGTLVNGPTIAPGKIGQSLRFNGIDNYVQVEDDPSLDGFTEFTASLWGKQNSIVEGGGLFRKWVDTSGNRSYDIYTSAINEITIRISSNGSTRETHVSANDCGFTSNGEWTYIAVTFNAGSISYYKNGVLCDTDSGAITSIFNSPQTLRFGQNESAIYFDGWLDDIRLYNRALSDTEIRDLYDWRG